MRCAVSECSRCIVLFLQQGTFTGSIAYAAWQRTTLKLPARIPPFAMSPAVWASRQLNLAFDNPLDWRVSQYVQAPLSLGHPGCSCVRPPSRKSPEYERLSPSFAFDLRLAFPFLCAITKGKFPTIKLPVSFVDSRVSTCGLKWINTWIT